MKIQCDVCEKEEASVYCTADEASLCNGCDSRVHHANKLANKHPRFSLLHPSFKDSPRCDICQEKRAFLFCKEDRAILCRECDISIHKANEYTQKHARFLLTGVKLSASASCYENSSNQTPCCSNSNGSSEIDNRKGSVSCKDQDFRAANKPTSVNDNCYGVSQGEGASMEASSISEYLMETLPGWRVEEFLDSTSSHPYGFCKGYESSTLPVMSYDPESNVANLGGFWSDDLGIWVNSSSSTAISTSSMDYFSMTGNLSKGLMLTNEHEEVNSFMRARGGGKMKEDQQTVPLFNPTTSSIKRPRQLW